MTALAGFSFGFDPAKPFVKISASLDNITPDPVRLAKFAEICGLSAGNQLPLIYPLTFIYPIVQMMLAHGKAPLALFKTLNTRMQIRQHRPIGANETIALHCEFAERRLVEKGLELDIQSEIRIEDKAVWENKITFYYRGNYGQPDKSFQPRQMEAIPDAPETARWFLKGGVGKPFASLSGDGNPIHYMKWYARFSGFKRDFAQPLLILTKAVERMMTGYPANDLCLDVAFKGPVYYNAYVVLRNQSLAESSRFDIYSEGNDRPCICCDLRTCAVSP